MSTGVVASKTPSSYTTIGQAPSFLDRLQKDAHASEMDYSNTAPSFFVAEILGPLRDFLGTHTSELELSGEAPAAGWRAAEWAAAVGDHVCDAYKTLAEASLDTVRKNEEALRRLHAKRDGSGAKEGEVADSAKIAAQLLLDVDALGAELAGLGVELKSESFGRLREAVRPDASAVAQLSGS